MRGTWAKSNARSKPVDRAWEALGQAWNATINDRARGSLAEHIVSRADKEDQLTLGVALLVREARSYLEREMHNEWTLLARAWSSMQALIPSEAASLAHTIDERARTDTTPRTPEVDTIIQEARRYITGRYT